MKKKIRNDKVKNINEYKKEKKNKHKRRQGRKVKKIILRFGLILICFITIIVNICGYSVIGNLKYDIYYLKKELKTRANKQLDELKAKTGTNSSIREIEERAKEELNMDYPKQNQIRYIEERIKKGGIYLKKIKLLSKKRLVIVLILACGLFLTS